MSDQETVKPRKGFELGEWEALYNKVSAERDSLRAINAELVATLKDTRMSAHYSGIALQELTQINGEKHSGNYFQCQMYICQNAQATIAKAEGR